jgi:ubiquinone/menaquinone biosynthesis C-methylase UbiE
MLIKKLLKEIKRVFDFLIGDKSDEIYWRYKSFFNSDWRNGYLDLNADTHPHRKFLLNKLTHLNLINSILEVGCANGINLRMINKKIPGIELEGFDINKKALSEGVNILKRKNITNIRLKHQSAKNLGSYDTGQFEVVLCDAVLMYIGPNNIKQVLKEIVRISKKSVIICEQHTNGNSFYDDKWIHNYDVLLKNISGIQSVIFHSISDDIWRGDWSKYGKIIVVEKT